MSTGAYASLSATDFTISVDTPAHNHIRIDEIDKVIKSKDFVLLSGDEAMADGNSWLKVTWDKTKITDERFIISDFTSQAYEDYYFIKDNKVIASHSSGFTDRFDVRPIKNFKFVAAVGDADYMLVKTCCFPGLPIYYRLLSQDELNKQYYQSLIIYAVVYSLIAMMILYNFFIYLYLRENQYLYYCYYLGSMLFILLILSGIGKQFIWPNLKHTEAFYFFSGINVSIASMLFMLNFLSKKLLPEKNKKLVYITIGLHLLLALFYFVTVPFGNFERFVNTLVHIVCIAGWFVIVYIIVKNIMAGDRIARVLLLSYSLTCVAGTIYLMRYSGVLLNSHWAIHVVDFAVLLEALILSLALAQKIRMLRNEKCMAEEKQLEEQKLFSRQLLQVQEEEKKQLGSALHDNFTHQLLVLKTKMANKLGSDAEETQQIDKVLNDMRDLSHMVHPYLLEKLGVKEAVMHIIDKTAQTYDIDINVAMDDLSLNKQQSLMVYRIIQESLNNIVKHAEASECLIAIKQQEGIVDLLIKDDGKGFDPDSKQGLGLTTIKERCNMLKGTLDIESDTDGSSLHISFPYELVTTNSLLGNNAFSDL